MFGFADVVVFFPITVKAEAGCPAAFQTGEGAYRVQLVEEGCNTENIHAKGASFVGQMPIIITGWATSGGRGVQSDAFGS